MLIDTLNTGDKVYIYNKSIVIKFIGKRGVLSTSVLNGGYSEEITSIFNNDAKTSVGMGCKLKAPTYKEHMEVLCKELGLEPKYTTGLGTAADMENMSKSVKKYGDLVVTALITGGIESNGGRVGDPASYIEENEKIEMLKPGTINTLIMIDGKIDAGVLARSLITATEAKTAVIQELLAGSNYSSGLATGSGTDGTIVCCNLESDRIYTNAGKHSKLGELIGLAVKEALKNALNLQSGLNVESQKSLLKRGKRFGITTESLWDDFIKGEKGKNIHKLDYMDSLLKLEKNESLVSYISLVLHLLDQYNWDLLSENIVKEHSLEIIKKITPNLQEFSLESNLVDNIIENIKKAINKSLEVNLNV